MHCLQVFPLIDVVESDIEGNQRVEVQLLKLIHCVLNSVDNPCDTLLLFIESAECALCLQSLLNEANDILGFLLTGQHNKLDNIVKWY